MSCRQVRQLAGFLVPMLLVKSQSLKRVGIEMRIATIALYGFVFGG